MKKQLNNRENESSSSSHSTNQQTQPTTDPNGSSNNSLFDESKVNVEVVSRKRLTDPNFNNYYRVQVKNNYNKPIASVRIASEGWVSTNSLSSVKMERKQTESVIVTIPPGQTQEITLRKSWEFISIVVDAVTFTDATSASSHPPVFQF